MKGLQAKQADGQGIRPNTAKPWRRWLLLCLAVLALCAGIWVWKEVLEDRLIPKRWGVIEPGLIYRSGQLHSALVEKTLGRYKIATIIALTFEDPNDQNQQAELAAARRLGIEVQRYPLAGDGTGDVRNYARAIAAIVQARSSGRPLLIHCAAGSQRTGAAVAFYRLLVERRTPASVYRELRRFGWKPADKALIDYVNRNIGELAELLKAMGVINDVPSPMPVLGAP